MAEKTVLFEVKDRVATITLNRPERMNAMNQQLKDELREAWERVKTDPDVWVRDHHRRGGAFSSGADVESLDAGGFTQARPLARAGDDRGHPSTCRRRAASACTSR